MKKGFVYTGTSGWSYTGWKEKFYPQGTPATKFFAYYRTKFNSVEINASFYRLPTVESVKKWNAMADKSFRFCPKISRYLTHMKKLTEPEEPLKRFFNVFDHLHEKMGPVLIQLPSMVRFDREKVLHFYDILSTIYRDYSFAIEPRSEDWYEETSIQAMKDHNIALVVNYSGGDFPLFEDVTARDIYLRFHGPGRLYASDYSEAQLKRIASKWSGHLTEGCRIWSFFNNDVNAYAPFNALKFHKLMTAEFSGAEMAQ